MVDHQTVCDRSHVHLSTIDVCWSSQLSLPWDNVEDHDLDGEAKGEGE